MSKGAKLETDQSQSAVRTDFSRDGFEVLSANGEFAVSIFFVSTGADDDLSEYRCGVERHAQSFGSSRNHGRIYASQSAHP